MPASHVDDLFRAEGDGKDIVVLAVHVQPGAGRSGVVGRHGAALKVRVAAAPEGGRANAACADLLAETFGVKPAQVELVSGAGSRSKQFRLVGVDVDAFRVQLERAVSGARPGTGAARP
ncbi:MAG TPA: DUF167 domain-containing protein [Acidimicrobiales bacterium]|nr:DUF167 domain-containing protein [Acidimicrobiales bacterium]